MSDKQPKKEAIINCPVCYSGNYFDLDQQNRELCCQDCGFQLADNQWLTTLDDGRCIVCNNEYFYFDSLLNLKLFRRSLKCYVCEASYKGVKMNKADEQYIDEVAQKLSKSDAARTLKERVSRWQ